MAVEKLDFFVIGAMKCGTTSLHYQLQRHPRIFLPAEKEAPFFAMDDLYEKGMDWYLREFFSAARADQAAGTVSPQYMLDPRVPRRIHDALPEARLIAILRDPIDRARSHYRMMVRAFGERRPFAQTLDGQYAEAGEYGRILGEYLGLFARERLLVLYLREFEIDPEAVLSRIYAFLGVDTGLAAAPVERRHTSEAARSRPLARFAANAVHTYLRPLRPLIKAVVPGRYTRRIGMWSIMYRGRGSSSRQIDTSLSREQERALALRYQRDLSALERIAGSPAPWRGRIEELSRAG